MDYITDIAEFISLPFNKQVHTCCLLWLKANHKSPFVKGKPSKEYYAIRGYLWKLSRQDIKNIAIMISEKQEPVPMIGLYNVAKVYMKQKLEDDSKAKTEAVTKQKEYDLDLTGFLNS